VAFSNPLKRARRDASGPQGVQIRIKPHNLPSAERSGRVLPGPLWWGLLLGVVFYVLAHLSIARAVWPVHGVSGGAGVTFIRDMAALAAWLLLFFVMRRMRYRGSWAVLVLPVMVFCLARPALFQAFTDPSYQARAGAKREANDVKATRSRLSTIERAYDAERKAAVYQGPAPELPDPFARVVGREAAGFFSRFLTYLPVLLAPLAVLAGYLLTRQKWQLRWFREHRLIPFVPALLVFFALAFVSQAGKVGGTTPWELLLPVFVAVWAATLAEDAYGLARPGQAFERRRLLNLFVYGALPLVPFLIIRELGLSIVLAGSLAAMLLVGTRRGWWAGLMLLVWGVLVALAFNVDDRSATRLKLAYDPYRDLSTMDSAEAQRWGERANYQIKLFDANLLEGGIIGEGAGRGHGETAPNAADDGYLTLVAAQWGLVGGVALVLLYTVFVIQMLGVAVREPGAFERTLVTGLAMLIAIPFWLATLGDVRVIPLTGVVAAFAAHGGSKLLAAALSVGLIAGISHRRGEEERLGEALDAPVADYDDDERVTGGGIRIR
jgi:cell division protein FtsW (lipid II flippase)